MCLGISIKENLLQLITYKLANEFHWPSRSISWVILSIASHRELCNQNVAPTKSKLKNKNQ